jgi:5-methyltetrahydrofolate--homocysteine methyltransferase
MSIVDEIKEAVIAGSAKKVKDAVERAVAGGLAVEAILHDGLIAGMDIIGARFKANEVYVPEVLVAARAMHAGLDVIKPLIVSSGIKEKGVIVIGTVQGDLHDIGKNLVVMMLEGAGYRVVNLGVDIPVDAFIRSVEEHKPQVVGLSALLTTTMPKLAETVAKLHEAFPGGIKVIVGGAPVTEAYAGQIGADGFAADAASAVEVVGKLVGGS